MNGFSPSKRYRALPEDERTIKVDKLLGGPVGSFKFQMPVPNEVIESGCVLQWVRENWRKFFFPGANIRHCGELNPRFIT